MCDRPPELCDECFFHNQVLAQIELWENAELRPPGLCSAKHLDEKVPRSLEKLGVNLTQLSDKQAEYIGVGSEGPFKPEAYRY